MKSIFLLSDERERAVYVGSSVAEGALRNRPVSRGFSIRRTLVLFGRTV